MPDRFLQIHTLTSYPASLLNRDDVGFAKRIPFGGAVRTRVSSQCLKRHWRTADDEHALDRIRDGEDAVPMAVRSRRTFEKHVYTPLVEEDGIDEAAARAVSEALLGHLMPESKAKQRASRQEGDGGAGEAGPEVARTQQVTVLGRPEVEYLRGEARAICAEQEDAGKAAKAVKAHFKGELKKNLEALRLGAGLDAALFGRMTTGDILSRCDAAIHVAHAFTVHEGFFETDYFSALDDLQEREETGSGHINTSELTTGIFYGYVVVDLPLLVSNLEGCERSEWQGADRGLAAEVVRRLIHLIATVSPGAKLGSTAPYSHSHLVFLEHGNAQPRTLANAFLKPARPRGGDLVEGAYGDLAGHLAELDRVYGRSTARAMSALHPTDELRAAADSEQDLDGLAEWAAERVRGA